MKKERMVEEKARLETSLSESKKELEAQRSLARGLQAEIKKLNTAVEVEMVEVDSDEENITTRKVILRSPSTTPLRNRSILSMPSSTTKRKLEDMTSSSVESGLDIIYQFGDCSDSEGQSQPKFKSPPLQEDAISSPLEAVNKSPSAATETSLRSSDPVPARPTVLHLPSPLPTEDFCPPHDQASQATQQGDESKGSFTPCQL